MKNKNKITKYFIFCTVFIILLLEQYSIAQEYSSPMMAMLTKNYFAPTSEIENLFKNNLQLGDSVIYTKVPRGLVISIDSLIFFKEGNDDLLDSAKPHLSAIANILRQINNNCIIESNTEFNSNKKSDYSTNWELSTVRAGKIADYLIKNEHISPSKISAIGYGEYMPFSTQSSNMDRRIDFVIINYEAQ
ncbi:OmpA family protein [bacterium]|nr:OmpA family protein [bacterium]